MRTHAIRAGSGSLDLTQIGFGAASLGNLYRAIDDATARATVDAAWESGIRYFDTAPHYGLGLSEQRLGAALAEHPREEYVISSKVGRLLVPRVPPAQNDLAALFDVPGTLDRQWAFNRDGVLRSLNDSLERLGLDYLDIALAHDPDVCADPNALHNGVSALLELRDQGVVRSVGIGTNDSSTAARALAEYDIDTVMLAGRYTLLRQEGFDDVAAAAGDRPIVLAGVFNSGILARTDVPTGSTFDYGPASQELLDRVREIARVAEAHGATLPQLAVQFVLRHETVAAVVLGTAHAAEVRANVTHLDAPTFAAWDELGL